MTTSDPTTTATYSTVPPAASTEPAWWKVSLALNQMLAKLPHSSYRSVAVNWTTDEGFNMSLSLTLTEVPDDGN